MDAIVFGGGVAKGGFAAGAVAALGEAGALRVRRIVGTSSGALNAAYFASAVRNGATQTGGDELCRIWIDEGTVTQGFDIDLKGVVTLEGVSNSDKLIALQRRHIKPATGRHPIDLRIVVTDSIGTSARLSPHREATTHERVLRFAGDTFDAQPSLEALFSGVAASSAFPGAYVSYPLKVPAHGGSGEATVPCFDGGLTNNTPIKYAIEGASEVDRVFVIVPFPAVAAPAPAPHGIALIAHLVDILVEERLFRDLREAYDVNATLERLEAEVPDAATRASALRAFGWSQRRKLEIVELRPDAELEGGPFDGVLSRRLREGYVAAGREVAKAWLEGSKSHAKSRHATVT